MKGWALDVDVDVDVDVALAQLARSAAVTSARTEPRVP